jgi:hypothetical protein
MINAPYTTTVNSSEFRPSDNSIAFAPELIQFVKDNQKLTTYRFGNKYDLFLVFDFTLVTS